MSRSILIRYEGDDRGTWCLYWTDPHELADPREFQSLEEAGRVANQLAQGVPFQYTPGPESGIKRVRVTGGRIVGSIGGYPRVEGAEEIVE